METINIWIAEDDTDDQKILEDAMLQSPYKMNPTFYNDGRQILAAIDNVSPAGGYYPHLVLIDVNMPMMKGDEVIQNLVDRKLLGIISVAVLTGIVSDDMKAKCMKLGCRGYFEKPLNQQNYLPILKDMRKIVDDLYTD